MKIYEGTVTYTQVQSGKGITLDSPEKLRDYMNGAFDLYPVQEIVLGHLPEPEESSLGEIHGLPGNDLWRPCASQRSLSASDPLPCFGNYYLPQSSKWGLQPQLGGYSGDSEHETSSGVIEHQVA